MLKITEKELDKKLELFNHGKGYMKMTPEEKTAIKIWFTQEFDIEVIEEPKPKYKILKDGQTIQEINDTKEAYVSFGKCLTGNKGLFELKIWNKRIGCYKFITAVEV